MKLIIGLGNPGKDYLGTRHNAGFEVVEALREILAGGERWSAAKKIKSETIRTRIEGEEVVLLRPLTFMNNSGVAVAPAVKQWKLAPADVWVIHDDLDFPIGAMRISIGASSAGHNGVQSIIDSLRTNNFARFRLGIAPESERHTTTELFVLDRFTKTERKHIDPAIRRTAEAIIHALRDGIPDAMTIYNKRP